ncbi:hypothetical protein QRD40_15895 [Comamonas sp. Y6]|uniref:DNA polymerase Y family protein n=1 Tax=Comamonas resistens TaxID=3046670 RepID=A0ABY8SY29_9BURK|nr:hypothetical protein [Comamonas resistens]MDL5037833.1 hypothetical protein [Comamonas resistens]WHS67650.1 hypothetical protein QMY55_11275 [Comamonas resistens]
MQAHEHWIAWPLALLAAPQGREEPEGKEAVPVTAAESACWWALEFSPRVAVLEEALLMETSMVQRLWGGLQPMLEQLDRAFALACLASQAGMPDAELGKSMVRAEADTPWLALARLRLMQRLQEQGKALPAAMPADALPLWTLTVLQQHSAVLMRLGCRTWGQARELPRAGLSRRLGGQLLRVLDEAYGLLPQPMNWLQLPETFVLRHDLGYPARNADAVLQVAQPLLRALQSWLQARHHAVLSLQLRWHHDLRRIDGQELPAWESLCIRTAQPTQGMAHLQRLLREHLGQQHWRAPVDMLELQALKTVPWSAAPLSCLPDLAAQQGSANSLAWHEWVERVGARWGDEAVRMVEPHADYRPEAMQSWKSAAQCNTRSAQQSTQQRAAALPGAAGKSRTRHDCSDPWQALWPPWLLPRPEALAIRNNRPHWHGPLQLRAGPYRLESGWWEGAQTLAARDYFVAFNEVVGHVWIYRERAQTGAWLTAASHAPSWFVQGVYG